MNLRIDNSAKEPVYEQICRQVIELVRGGLLQAGTKLPSVRQLAQNLGISKTTVAQAYEELAAMHIVSSNHGSGTYICAEPDVATGTDLSIRHEMQPSLDNVPPMRWEPYHFQSDFFGLPLPKGKGKMIRFTQANPDPALFPFDRIKQVATNMLWYPKEFFFDIGHAQGYQPLVELLEKEMALTGVPMAEGQNDILLTGGFQRAVSLLLDVILRPGQKIAVESPNYPNLLNLLISKRVNYVPVPVDAHGMDTDYLATVLAQGDVRAVIVTPLYHNPTGVSMSQERREHLIKLAVQYRLPIIEDDWGRLLRYEGQSIPPLKSMDPGGYVLHIGSYSKCFLPGLRIGWITCPAAISELLVTAKMGSDRSDSFFIQALLHNFIQKGHFDRHLRHVLKEYKKRRDAMCRTLAENLPGECRFRIPQGGLSIWLELPGWMKSLPLWILARKTGVDFVPATMVTTDRQDAPALRLAFSRSTIEEITEGIGTLCRLLADCISDPTKLDQITPGYEELYR